MLKAQYARYLRDHLRRPRAGVGRSLLPEFGPHIVHTAQHEGIHYMGKSNPPMPTVQQERNAMRADDWKWGTIDEDLAEERQMRAEWDRIEAALEEPYNDERQAEQQTNDAYDNYWRQEGQRVYDADKPRRDAIETERRAFADFTDFNDLCLGVPNDGKEKRNIALERRALSGIAAAIYSTHMHIIPTTHEIRNRLNILDGHRAHKMFQSQGAGRGEVFRWEDSHWGNPRPRDIMPGQSYTKHLLGDLDFTGSTFHGIEPREGKPNEAAIVIKLANAGGQDRGHRLNGVRLHKNTNGPHHTWEILPAWDLQ